MNFIFMEILTISYTYIWNLYPKNIIVFCQKKYGNKEKKPTDSQVRICT